MQRGADRGGVKMTKRLEVLIEQIPVGIDAALITGYEIIRYYTGQSVRGHGFWYQDPRLVCLYLLITGEIKSRQRILCM